MDSCSCRSEGTVASKICVICRMESVVDMEKWELSQGCGPHGTPMFCGHPEFVCIRCKEEGWYSTAGCGGQTRHINPKTNEEKHLIVSFVFEMYEISYLVKNVEVCVGSHFEDLLDTYRDTFLVPFMENMMIKRFVPSKEPHWERKGNDAELRFYHVDEEKTFAELKKLYKKYGVYSEEEIPVTQ